MNSSVVVYIDDIIVHSPTMDDHLQDLERFFTHIKKANMVLNANKCSFFDRSVNFVGFVANEHGYSPNPKRIQAIASFPRPVCQGDVRAFLGINGIYKRHIYLFADCTAPLTNLLKKNAPFIWTENHESCFLAARSLLQEKCPSVYPDPTKSFYLFTDASDIGIGAALCRLENDEHLPVAILSRKLQPAEVRYPTVEKELMAVVVAF
ncbi:hypothetical protein [Absidia glauca]|uniref:Reverse transcriptase domain-containing protein n=1 Tax=Absidia glauca TaxID=4829 RepID=A0A168N4C8_ABSGL|nr:hypothetical protein [Absidia glauca]